MKAIQFTGCKLQQVDFAEADLRQASLEDCDLSEAIFFNTNLEGADFESASGFEIDPENNRIKGAKFSPSNIRGLLVKYKIRIKGGT